MTSPTRTQLIGALVLAIVALSAVSLMAGRVWTPLSAWTDTSDPRWTIIFALRLPRTLLGLAVGAVLLALGLALFVVLAPIGIAVYFYVRWKMGKVLRDLQARQEAMQPGVQRESGNIIDAEYVVIEDPQRKQ